MTTKSYLLAATLAASALAAALPAAAAITVETSPFITSPIASTSFATEACCQVPLNSSYSDGGITITDVSQGIGQGGNNFIYTDFSPVAGDMGFYAAGSTGYYDITLTNGGSFDSLQFSGFSGFGATSNLYFEVFDHGVSVGTGSVGIPGYPNFGTYGVSGATFDEVLVQTQVGGSGIDSGAASALGVDEILIGGAAGVPEPATWALMILGFGGLGASLRRRRMITAPAECAR